MAIFTFCSDMNLHAELTRQKAALETNYWRERCLDIMMTIDNLIDNGMKGQEVVLLKGSKSVTFRPVLEATKS